MILLHEGEARYVPPPPTYRAPEPMPTTVRQVSPHVWIVQDRFGRTVATINRVSPHVAVTKSVGPGRPVLGTQYINPPSRERGVLKGIGKALGDFPGITGFAVGVLIPWMLPWKVTAVTGASVGLAGYLSPSGSWLTRFAGGFGIGGAVASGIYFRKEIAGTVGVVRDVIETGSGLIDVLRRYPWTHYLPVVGPFLETLYPTP